MLQMNLFDRFQRVAKANLNNVLQSLEDPEKIMTQALEDMQVRKKEPHVIGRMCGHESGIRFAAMRKPR
jgi:PspA/IM30 family